MASHELQPLEGGHRMIDSGHVMQSQPTWKYEGQFAPIVASILAVLAWAIFILLYALYWSNGFSLFQNVVVTIVSLIITGLLIGLMWVVWGFKGGWRRDISKS
jgi:hypothetical protein